MATILVLHGPNLNLLGSREPEMYGTVTLKEINQRLSDLAQANNHNLLLSQNNAEHELIEHIHNATSEGVSFIVFNPAAFTHTSIALRDALLAVEIPFIEVHMSNIHCRESFRKHSYFSDIATGVIYGFGYISYQLALLAAIEHLQLSQSSKIV
jgi:3-dehydroquinate dehydratase-2